MKSKLRKLAKEDPLAEAYYCAFKAEEASILAKEYSLQRSQDYTDKYYEQKSDSIWHLVAICNAHPRFKHEETGLFHSKILN